MSEAEGAGAQEMKTSRPDERRLAIAEERLLRPFDLDRGSLEAALDELMAGETDFADLYFQAGKTERWRLEDEKVATGSFSIIQGFGVRAVAGDRTAFAYSSDMTQAALKAAIDTANGLDGKDAHRLGTRVHPVEGPSLNLYPAVDPIIGQDAGARVGLLREIDRRARAIDPRIVRVAANLEFVDEVILVANSDGALAGDIRPLVRLQISVIAEHGDRRARGSAGAGGRFDISGLNDDKIDLAIFRATRTALINLDARQAPHGVMTVVLGPGFPGVLLHEAVGHGLEADAIRRKTSIFADRIGSSVAAPGVTVVDDATLPGLAGSLNIDDEGSPGEKTVLIERGRVQGLMQDRMNASLMNLARSGNARRQSYAHLPMPRMTNTYLQAGDHDPEEVVHSVKSGLYVMEIGGGSVNVSTGQFNFSAVQAYLIEDGRITAPVKGATLIGAGHEALNHISMIGSDLKIDEGEAVCGKQGQQIYVGVGQPTVRIDEMMVGGSS